MTKFKPGDKVRVNLDGMSYDLNVLGKSLNKKIVEIVQKHKLLKDVYIVKFYDVEFPLREKRLELVKDNPAGKQNNHDGMIYNPYTDSWSWF